MNDLVAKGRRVVGFFLSMVGTGLLLESGAVRSGAALLLAGIALFASGFVSRRRAERRRDVVEG